MREINGREGLIALTGAEWGSTDWFPVTQDQVNAFADATRDHQWIHVDVARSKAGPFGGTIAHGFLTLSMVPFLSAEVATVRGFSMGINYGLNKVRFPTSVPVGSRIRASVTNLSTEDIGDSVQIVNRITIEVEGATKPACVAEAVARFYP